MIKRNIVTTILASLFLLLPLLARAAEPGLTISPAVQQITISDTEKTPVTVKVTNRTSATQVLTLATVDFGALEDTGGLYFIGQPNDFERKYGLAEWIELPQKEITLAAGAEQKVNVMLRNLPSLKPGGHYGAVLFKNTAQIPAPGQPQVGLNPVLSELIFATKLGGENYRMSLDKVERKGTTVNLTFSNKGNIHVIPRGIVEVEDSLGRVVSSSVINENSAIILPESRQIMAVKLKSLAFGFMPGQYHLRVRYRYDGLDDFALYETSFYSLGSGWVWLVVLIVLAGLVTVIWRWRRKRKK